LLKLFEGSEKHMQVAWQFLEQSEKKAWNVYFVVFGFPQSCSSEKG
jgi:hypothetical protein